MILLPVDPGPPEGVYQNELVSFTEFGPSTSCEPAKFAVRSPVPHPLPNTYAPPLLGSSETFMNPCHGAAGFTPTFTTPRAGTEARQDTPSAIKQRRIFF